MGAGELFVSERDPTAGGPSGRHPPGEPASQREGDGPLIALVHGSLDRSASFARLLSRLSHYRVLSYDRRGYGRSVASAPGHLSDHVRDLQRLLARRPAVAVGHSFGAHVAMAAAATRSSVRAIVAWEPPLPWLGPWARAAPGRARPGAELDGVAVEAFLRRLLGESRWAQLPERTRAARRAEGPALAADMACLESETMPFELSDVAVPVIVGMGTDSTDYHRQACRELVAALPRGELVEVAGAGHGAHRSHPSALAQLVERAVALAGIPARQEEPGPVGTAVPDAPGARGGTGTLDAAS